MSDCPVALEDLRRLGGSLALLAGWIEEQLSARAGAQGPPVAAVSTPYSRGSAIERGRAALAIPAGPFPGIPALVLEQRWVLVTPERPLPVPPWARSAELPPPLPEDLLTSLDLVAADRAAALDSLETAFQSGFFAGVNLRTYTPYRGPRIISEPPFQYVVLRAPGVGAYVRLRRSSDFDFVCRVSSWESIGVGFRTYQELEAFCRGATVPLPPLFERC